MIMSWCLWRFLFSSPSGERRPDPSPRAKPFAARAKKACCLGRSRNVTENKGRRASGVVTINVWLGRRPTRVHPGPPYLAGNQQDDAWGAAYHSPIFEPAREPPSKATMCPGINRYVNYVPIAKAAAGIAGKAGGLGVLPLLPRDCRHCEPPNRAFGELSLLTRLCSGRGEGASLSPAGAEVRPLAPWRSGGWPGIICQHHLNA